jgi:glycosyltransferase involved in cell wall biosynthesis
MAHIFGTGHPGEAVLADKRLEEPSALRVAESPLGMAFVGTYPPRRCGIATFTRDLSQAVAGAGERVTPVIVALTDSVGPYEYPQEVRYEIRQGVKSDYERAAEFVNYSEVRVVSLQHEHGIFGGDDGAYVIDLLSALRVPAIVTLHTVLRDPSPSQRAIVQRMAKLCARVVVMSRVAADLLASSYGVTGDRVQVIPHGIPEMEPTDQGVLKAAFGVEGRHMLLTFGLLGPSKGIETVIRALPAVSAAFPDLTYFVVGATHPAVARRHGEAYRASLEREAERLGVREHLVFRDQFVTNAELCSYLQATDIFITPYQNEAQVTSGALSYAMGAGAAAVSTPYWHAQELLADGRGRLFPFGDHAALANTLISLLAAPDELARARAAAHELTRSMVWPHVGRAYLALGKQVLAETPRRSRRPFRTPASSLPELRLDHLLRMTDDTGIIQHATYSVPARRTGYCVDDNARALVVALGVERLGSSPETSRLVTTYLSYLHLSQTETGGFRNLMDYNRVLQDQDGSEDCLGRALWALGTTVQLSAEDGYRLLAREMFQRALPGATNLGPRGAATAMLGLAAYLTAEPDSGEARQLMARLAEKLVEAYRSEASDDWRWFEPTLTYDNALIPMALFKAYAVLGDRANLRVARESLEFLEEVCFKDGQLVLVGNDGWHGRGSAKAVADEQPLDAAALVLACRGAYFATGDSHYLRRMDQAFAWFLGANRLNAPVYDFSTAGCRDGLGTALANHNQGAESTIAFLLSLLAMLEVAGEAAVDATVPTPPAN